MTVPDGPVRLTRDERSRLSEMARALRAEDPRLVRMLSVGGLGTRPARTRRGRLQLLLAAAVAVVMAGGLLAAPAVCLVGWTGVLAAGVALALGHSASTPPP